MKKYDVSLAIKIGWYIVYWNEAYIYAESKNEAVEAAKEMAVEDIGVNSATFNDINVIVYHVNEVDEVEG